MKYFKKSKKGTHVGVMLSFIIFITFLIFLYIILEPAFKTQRSKDFLLNDIKAFLMQEVSEEIVAIPLNFTSANVNQGCIKVTGQHEIFSKIDYNHLIIKDEEGNFLYYSKLAESGVQGIQIEVGSVFTKGLLTVFYSDELSPYYKDLDGCPKNSEGTEFEVGTIRTSQTIFNTTLLNLIEEYETNYTVLKEKLGIPAGYEFSISFLDSEKNVIGEAGEKDPPTNVYVEEMIIEYSDEAGNTKIGFIVIRIW